MKNEEKNEKIENIFESGRTSAYSPIIKTSTLIIPYNKKKVGNIQNRNKTCINNEKVNIIHKKNNLSDNFNNIFLNKTDEDLEISNLENKINNKVINININYNDKYNYFDNYQSGVKNNEKILNYDILNRSIKEKLKNKSIEHNNILEIDLKNINTCRNKSKKSYANKNTITNKQNNINQNSLKYKKVKKDNVINSIRTIVTKSSNINNKIKLIESINDKNLFSTEEKYVDNVLKLINDENIILFLNENNKAETRRKGFLKLNKFIMDENNKDIIINNIDDFFMFIYFKLSSFQENNILLLTDGLSCILHIFECKKKFFPKKEINKKYMEILINKFKDKITDIKLKNIFIKLLYIFINIFPIKDVFDIILNNILKIKNINILKELINFFKNILEKIKNKNRIKNLNIKKLMLFIIQMVGANNNPELRTSCVKLLCVLYKIYGKIIKEILINKNESLLNIVEKEMKKIDSYYDYNSERNNNKINNKIGQSKSFMIKNKININTSNKKINLNNNVNNIKKVINISKEITPNLIDQLSSGDFESRKNAVNYINKLVIEHKNNISINGLKDLFFLIKEKINDEDTNYASLILFLLSNLIIALGLQIMIYAKIFIYPLLLNLSNKSQQIRENSFICIENWIKVQGINIINNYVPELLSDDNKNNTMKLEILNLLLNNYNLIEIENNENFIERLCRALLKCLTNNNMLIRNNTEKLIKKLYVIIKKELYTEEINKSNFETKEKEYLYQKINSIFSNFSSSKKNKNKIIIKNISRTNKQNSFNNQHFKLISEISSDSESKNKSNNSNKNTLNYKGKVEGRNNSKHSYYSMNGFNIKTRTLYLNHSCDHLGKNKKKNSLIIYDKTLNSILKNIYNNQSPNLIKFSNNNINYNRISTNSSLPIRRKKTDTNKFNKLIFSSIIMPSKIKKKLIFDNDSKLLPHEIKNEIRKLKTVRNINNKRNFSKKLNVSDRKKKLSSILNINQSHNSSCKNRNFLSQVIQTEIFQNKKNIFIDNLEFFIFSANYEKYNHKKAKQIRYEEEKKNNFELQKIQNLKSIQEIKAISKNIFSLDFIHNMFSDNIENIIFSLSQLNKLINNLLSNNDTYIFDKLFDNLDIILKILSIQLSKYNDNSLTKSFFIFAYSLIKLSKAENYLFTETEITLLTNIICNKLTNNKEIISETANNLIFFLSSQCENKTFIPILVKLLKYQKHPTMQETLKIIKNLSEVCKYDKEIMSVITEDIIKIYFYNKDKSVLSLLKNIFDSIGNKIWERCKFLSKENKELLSKNLFECKQKTKGHHHINITNEDNDIVNINDKNNVNNVYMSSSSKKKSNNNKAISYNKNKISKIKHINNIKDDNINHKSSKSNEFNNQNKVIKRNKTSENMMIFRTPTDVLSKYSSNNISFDLKFNNLYDNEEKDNNKSQDKNIESKILKALNILNSSYVKEEISIDAILTIYNIVYKNYNQYKNIILKNIDNIVEVLIKKIEKLFDNVKDELKLIKYLFNILNKFCIIENFMNKISFKNHQKLFLLLICSFINKEIKIMKEKNFEDVTEDKNILNDFKIIFKSINCIITQIIKNFDITNNILALINIIKNNRMNNRELVEYCIRCLSFVFKKIKEKYSYLKINIIFNNIQSLLDDIEQKKEVIEINNSISIDNSIILVMKNLVIEIVMNKKEYFLEYQNNIKNKLMKKWVQDILKNKKTINKDNNNNFNKGFLFEGETFYPRVNDKINMNNNDVKINYSPEERIERNFKNIKKKWTNIQKNE